ncbi:WD40-repeat-containing domain protein [Cladochytrium replicatum]|nr:WD40-repeat-containing domain protein [Cladochytrium replicatum]
MKDDFFVGGESSKKRKRVVAPAKGKSKVLRTQKKDRSDDEDSIGDQVDMDAEDIREYNADDKDVDEDEEMEARETAAEKRLRLAKRYLKTVEEEMGDADEIDAGAIDRQLIAERLQSDVLESEGKLFNRIALRYRDFYNTSQQPHIQTLHIGNKRQGHSLSITSLAFAVSHPPANKNKPASQRRSIAAASIAARAHADAVRAGAAALSAPLDVAAINGDETQAPSNNVHTLHTSKEDTSKGIFLYSTSKDGSIVQWDLRTLKKVFCLPGGEKRTKRAVRRYGEEYFSKHVGHAGAILCSAASHDGRLLATGGQDKMIHLWSAWDLSHLGVFKHHRDMISGLAFRRGSPQLYSSSYDRTVKVWNAADQIYVETLFGHQDQITSIDTLAKERCVTTGSRDRTVRLWKVVEESQLVFRAGGESGKKAVNEVDVPGCRTTCVDVVAMLDEENWVSGSDAGTISLWNINRKKPVFSKLHAHGHPQRSSFDLTNVKTAKPDSAVTTECCWITALAAVRYSDLFASGSCTGSVKLWAVTDEKRSFVHILDVPVVGFVNALLFFNAPVSEEVQKEGGPLPPLLKKEDPLWLGIGVGQEHRMGRWARVREAKNEIKLVVLG